ncbi:spondin-2-like [Lissotriton helveticus]
MASKRLSITLILGFCVPFVHSGESSCGASGPANFSVSFSAEWSPSSFPKHYPTHRPPAQWSSLFGCTHKSDFVLWANGSFVPPGVRVFVENGKPQLLIEELEVVEDKVWSWFQAAKIPSGEGNTTTIITMEPSHPFVSIIVRIVPSPDWFVGVSSLNLCENGKWRTRKLFDLFPWDAGTDSGFTFSSPNFETQPQEAVSQITAMTPSHPANSFYYPRIKKLPRLGFLEFSLLAAETNKATQNGTESPPVNSEQILEECILDGDATHHKNATESRQQKGNNTDEEFKSSESFTLKQHCGKSTTHLIY